MNDISGLLSLRLGGFPLSVSQICANFARFGTSLRHSLEACGQFLPSHLPPFIDLPVFGVEPNPGPPRSQTRRTRRGKRRPSRRFLPLRAVQQTSPIHTYQFGFDGGVFFTTSASVTTGIGYSFNLAQFPGYTSYTTLYDMYRFDWLEVQVIPSVSITQTGAPITGYYVETVDLDDAVSPTGPNVLLQYAAHRVHRITQTFKRAWRPRLAVSASDNTGTPQLAFNTRGWVDGSSPTIAWFGFKMAAPVTTAPVSFNLIVNARVSFRAQR